MVAAHCDYHVHTRFSDGRDDPAACVERASRLGLSELGFAEHVAPAAVSDDSHCPVRVLGGYVSAVRSAAARHPGLRVLCGVEVDWAPGSAVEIREILASSRFDFALCAVHVVDGLSIDEACYLDAEGWRDADRVWRRYYETLTEAAGTGLFTAVAHLDLPKKWGFRPSRDVSGLEDDLLQAVAVAGLAIEINTAGIRHPVGEPYPAAALLRRARAAGIPVTFGSDAHRAVDIGAGYGAAAARAAAAGYTSWVRPSDSRRSPL